MPHPKVDEVCRHAKARMPRTIERLSGYLRHPAMSNRWFCGSKPVNAAVIVL